MIHVGIADDDALVRSTLTDLLATTEDIRVAWAASDGQEALELIAAEQPPVQVLLLDVQMPRMDGIALATRLHQERPDLAVLVLTTFVADAILDRALAAGVRGFIAKEDSIDSLAATIRHVAAGNMVLSPTSSAIIGHRPAEAQPLAARVAVQEMPPVPLPTGVSLSPREMEVLALMVDALSNKQIAHRLCLSEATVKTHVSTIIAKLGVQDRVGAVVHALRAGLV
ncbi:Response regulator protein vraR [Actinomyces bovis]|uniref:Response regulator protein vraR n=1 Tax=Actinomyces bovis TaxID=1658 RepID=A0ABY1VR36_9ACTO|nr:response regulator transcription factor [Actinomyces bovis]SPT54429.1 Response regulator protein vraR [Actinomyces bovis]VEG55980.1 Response regulator protein vraR [Actinomyces israelii]